MFKSNDEKSPRLDGFNVVFFNSCWEIIDDESQMLFFTLFPKKTDACEIRNYWPISLCNFFYKFITKILANQIQEVIPCLINEAQMVFIKRRMVFYAILLVNNLINDFDHPHYPKCSWNLCPKHMILWSMNLFYWYWTKWASPIVGLHGWMNFWALQHFKCWRMGNHKIRFFYKWYQVGRPFRTLLILYFYGRALYFDWC